MTRKADRTSRSLPVFASIALLVFSSSLHAGQTGAEPEARGSTWKFDVYLDDREIGYHHFHVAEAGETRQIKSVASFDYRLLFVPLFRYEHENREIWQGDCLHSIESFTDSNGEEFRVSGRQSAAGFQVSTIAGEATLPECVMSFAYWNPAFLEQPTLLNTQNGEFLPVSVTGPTAEELDINGTWVTANRFGLSAGTLRIELWYSEDREWLALESEVRGGRKLRYVLNEDTVLMARTERDRPVLTSRHDAAGAPGLGD